MIVFQLILYCLLFTVMVKIGVGNGALNVLYFYPRAYQEKVYEMGLADREVIKRRRKVFMTAFLIVMTAALFLILGLWNKADNFLSAYLQALLFLEVMNWYYGIVIDKVLVGKSKFWKIPNINMPYVQTWKQVLKKRGILTQI